MAGGFCPPRLLAVRPAPTRLTPLKNSQKSQNSRIWGEHLAGERIPYRCSSYSYQGGKFSPHIREFWDFWEFLSGWRLERRPPLAAPESAPENHRRNPLTHPRPLGYNRQQLNPHKRIGGNMVSQPVKNRLFAKTAPGDPPDSAPENLPPGQCQNWTGATNRGGFGVAKFEGKLQPVHRIMWQLERGDIPADTPIIRQVCGSKTCINLEHLAAITVQEDQRLRKARKPGEATIELPFHCWRFNARRNILTLQRRKRLSRHDTAEVPAVWWTESAARAWLVGNTRHGGVVLLCRGLDCDVGGCPGAAAAGKVDGRLGPRRGAPATPAAPTG